MKLERPLKTLTVAGAVLSTVGAVTGVPRRLDCCSANGAAEGDRCVTRYHLVLDSEGGWEGSGVIWAQSVGRKKRIGKLSQRR